MLSRRSLVVAGTGARLLLADPAPIIVTIVLPVLFGAFLLPSSRAQLRQSGIANATGAEHLVPGLAVLFAFLGVSLVGTLFFREHAWGTWDRLRASSASTADIFVGKLLPLYACLLAQLAVVFTAGAVMFGYRVTGSLLALAVVLALFVAVLVAFGAMLAAVFRTMDQAIVIGNVGGMAMAGLGGALAPASTLPAWAQAAAHASPAYWTLDAIEDITLHRAGLADVTTPLAVLAGFLVLFSAVAVARFRAEDTKVGTT
ncbi:MAG: ABC transporter permease [Micromonosporaceae bacterium]|nr:ABC transporter permease [Micromonosporaceae bacterium]